MIKITKALPNSCPQFYCDHCGKVIVKGGNYEWRVDSSGYPVDGVLAFTHKHCSRPFNEANGGRLYWNAMELGALPIHLLHGMQVSIQWAKNHAGVLEIPLAPLEE